MWYLKVWGFQGSLFWTKKVQGVKYGGLCVGDPPAKNTDLEALCTGLLSSVCAQCTVAQPAYQKRPILGSVKIPGTAYWPHPPNSHPSWGRQKGVQWHKGARKPVYSELLDWKWQRKTEVRVKCPDEGSKAKTQRGLGLFFGTHTGQDNAAVITLHILLIHSNNFFYRFEPNDTHSVEMSLVCF